MKKLEIIVCVYIRKESTGRENVGEQNFSGQSMLFTCVYVGSRLEVKKKECQEYEPLN